MLLVTNETITNQKLVISNQYLMSPPPTKKVSIFSLRGQFKPLKQLFESLKACMSYLHPPLWLCDIKITFALVVNVTELFADV